MEKLTGFADLHCHPHMRSFNWFHSPEVPENNSIYSPWNIIFSKKRAEKKGSRATAYSQCDMAKVINGELKLVFASMYPLEQGWVSGRKKYTIDFRFTPRAILQFLKSFALYMIGNDRKDHMAIRDILQVVFMKIPLKRVNYVQSSKYNYFEELKEEKVFLDKKNGVKAETELHIRPKRKKLFINLKRQLEKEKERFVAEGEYVMAKDGNDVKKIINEGKTAFVLTIEGANVFNTEKDFESIKANIDVVKNWKDPLFFITLAHHFNNDLAGHARSIPDVGNLVLDQSENMNKGFTEKGLNVTRYLLSIDEEGNYKPKEFGRRILIDVKHSSAATRKEFYEKIAIPALKSNNPTIPVIASHVCYSGVEKLQQLIDDADKEKSENSQKRYGHSFNNWNINLCDEDVVNIFKTGGLIGINLDQRVLGVDKKDKKNKKVHAHYVWQNIKAMMLAVINSPDVAEESKMEVVGLFCLGTDFDGFIDPINSYPTVMQFGKLREDLIREIEIDPEKGKLLYGFTPQELVDKICIGNAYVFVQKNFK